MSAARAWPPVALERICASEPYAIAGGPFGSDLTRADYVDNAGVPVIRGTNLGGDTGQFVDDGFVYVTDQKAASLAKNLARPGDLIFTQRGTLGQVAVIPPAARFPRYVVSQSQMKISVDPKVADAAFVWHYFRSPQAQSRLLKHALATGVPHINLGILKRLTLPLPRLPEQRRIAALLDKADAIRRKRQQAIRLADDLLRSAFLDMFGDPVTNPKGWPACRLADVAVIVSGVTKGRKLDRGRIISVPYMRVANVQDGHLVLDDVKEIEALPEEVTRYCLEPGDVLLTEGGDPDKLGRGAVWRGQVDPCIHQNHIFRVRPNKTKVLAEFLSRQIGSARGKRYFLRAAKQTTGIASINMTQLSAFPVLLPPLDAQERFGRLTRGSEALKARLAMRASTVGDLFEALVQRAFLGSP